jgi:hypothetical protein
MSIDTTHPRHGHLQHRHQPESLTIVLPQGQQKQEQGQHHTQTLSLSALVSDPRDVRIKKPALLQRGRTTMNLRYGQDNSRLLFQMPPMRISRPFDGHLTARGTIALTSPASDAVSFARSFLRLQDALRQRIQRAFPTILPAAGSGGPRDKPVVQVQCGPDGNEHAHATLGNDGQCISVYDTNRRASTLDVVDELDTVICLFSIDYFWTTPSCCGIECSLHQILKIHIAKLTFSPAALAAILPPHLPQPPGPAPPPPPPPAPPPPPPIQIQQQHQQKEIKLPEKYERMLKMGIPMDAVRHKMKLDGCGDPTMMSTVSNDGANSALKNVNKVPNKNDDPNAALFAAIKSGNPLAALRKRKEAHATKETSRMDEKEGRSKDPRVPSLGDILQARSNLRTVQRTERRCTLPVGGNMPFLQDIAKGAWSLRKRKPDDNPIDMKTQ